MVYNYDAVKVHYNFLDRAVRRLSVQEQSPDVRRDVANASSLETTPVVGALSGFEATSVVGALSGLEATSVVGALSGFEATPVVGALSGFETTPVVGALSLLVIRTSIRDKNLSLFVAYIGGHTSVEGIHTTRVNHSANLRS